MLAYHVEGRTRRGDLSIAEVIESRTASGARKQFAALYPTLRGIRVYRLQTIK
jgi:hypothetical protein